jgi:hypothetical protein
MCCLESKTILIVAASMTFFGGGARSRMRLATLPTRFRKQPRLPIGAFSLFLQASKPVTSLEFCKKGYEVSILSDGFLQLVKALALDYLFIDTHPGSERRDSVIHRHF